MDKFKRKIILVAGHSLSDPGAVSAGFRESEKTRRDRDGVKAMINHHYPGLEVLTDNDNWSLAQVIAWIKSIEGDGSKFLVYDNHWNAVDNTQAKGAEAFIGDNHSQKSKDMATSALGVITAIADIRSRGVKTESQSARGRLGIFRIKSPVCLLEWGFISNKGDRDAIRKWDGWIYEDFAHDIAKHAR